MSVKSFLNNYTCNYTAIVEYYFNKVMLLNSSIVYLISLLCVLDAFCLLHTHIYIYTINLIFIFQIIYIAFPPPGPYVQCIVPSCNDTRGKLLG